MAAGDELLIVDGAENHREGMRKVFDEDGYVCTAVATGDDARDLVARKFFPAALIDLDVDRPGAGIELARNLRERSPQTGIVILTSRRSFEAAVEAIRAGCIDVVVKRPEEVAHLRRIIAIAADRYRSGDKGGSLLRDVQKVVDEAIKIMIGMARVVYADPSTPASGKDPGGARKGPQPKILVIDADSAFLKEIAQAIGGHDWEIAAEMTGGSALEKAGDHKFDIVACRDELPDLPGSMVLKSMQAARPEIVGLLYTAPGGGGRIERWEQERSASVERPFRGASHLVEKIAELATERGSLERDRRVIQKFRADHADFLRRWSEMKSRLDAL